MPTLTDLRVDYVSLVDRAAVRDPIQQSEPQRFLVWKRDSADHTHEGGSMTEEEKAALAKAQADAKAATEALTKATEAIETLKAENAELKKAAEPVEKKVDVIDLSKADPAMRAYVEKMEADRKADRERAEKSDKIAAEALEKVNKAEDARLDREFLAKAESYKALPVEAAKFGPVLKAAAATMSTEQYAELERTLKAADEQIGASDLFKEQGRAREGVKADGAYAEVTKRATEIRKSDPKISLVKAQEMAFAADPDLQARYLAETR